MNAMWKLWNLSLKQKEKKKKKFTTSEIFRQINTLLDNDDSETVTLTKFFKEMC